MQRLRSASALGVLFSAVAACSPTPSNTDAAVPDSGGSDGSTAMEAGPAGEPRAWTRGALITPPPAPGKT